MVAACRCGPATHATPRTTVAGPAFELELRASLCVVAVPAGGSILRAVEDAGVAVLSWCRERTSGACETDVLDGVLAQ
jgi:ferredoxin